MVLKEKIVSWRLSIQPWLTRLKEVMASRRGEGSVDWILPAGDKKAGGDKQKAIERDMVVNGVYIRIKSIFGEVPLEKTLANIAMRKLAGLNRSDEL